LLDLVADYAASTPTDAAKHIVPDLAAELVALAEARTRIRGLVHRRIETERALIAGLPERLRRSVGRLITTGQDEAERARDRIRGRLAALLDLADADNAQLLARVVSLSPQAVLDRGYAVLWNSEGALVRNADDTTPQELLQVRVARGGFSVRVLPSGG
jgi:exodeoxyribonuclease VII large subunit